MVSFANTMVVMTTNLGSRSVQQTARGGLGFGTMEDSDEAWLVCLLVTILTETITSEKKKKNHRI